MAQTLFITLVFQQCQQSHPISAALPRVSGPCLQGRSCRGNRALLQLTISLDPTGCSPFKSSSGHRLGVFLRDLDEPVSLEMGDKQQHEKMIFTGSLLGFLCRNPCSRLMRSLLAGIEIKQQCQYCFQYSVFDSCCISLLRPRWPYKCQ